jgi:SPP1 gp7 family putative phage head morphogenesis protein
MSNPPVTKQKQKWAKGRNVTFRGTQLNYNAAQQAKYQKAILTLVRQMSKETKDQIAELFKSETSKEYIAQQKQAATDANITSKAKKVMNALMAKFEALFSLKAKPMSETMVNGAQQVSKSNLHTSLKQLSGGLSLKTGVIPKGMEEVSNAIVAENVALIKSIPSQYFTDVTGSVMRSITTGAGLFTLIPQIQKYNGITERRARNIALDQTRKAYNSINKQRMQAIGVKQFEWVHSGGGQHPRRSHIAMSGNIYSFDNLPVINKEQVDAGYEGPVTGIPGQAINCKCTMVPVVEFDDGEPKE